MNEPVLTEPFRVAPDVHVLSTHVPLPSLGVLPINAFLVEGAEPTLIDTGVPLHREGFLEALWSLIRPEELAWVALTHDDPDHTGSLFAILEAAPQARLLTNFLSFGRLQLTAPIPPERVHLVNPGERVTLGDRTVAALRPPLFDNPGTIGLYDERSKVLFSADCFGALLPSLDAASVTDAGEIPEDTLSDGQVSWAAIECPWAHDLVHDRFAHALDRIRRVEPKVICSSHLPPMRGRTDDFLETLTRVPDAEPFIPPNQGDLEEMLVG